MMLTKIIVAAGILFTGSVAAQSDSTRMQRTKSTSDYQRDTSRIEYKAPVDRTVQDTATHYHDGAVIKDRKPMGNQDTSRIMHNRRANTDERYAPSRSSGTEKRSADQDKKHVKSQDADRPRQQVRDTSKNMYLIEKDKSTK